MNKKDVLDNVASELEQAALRAECRKCGCMKETLDNLRTFLSSRQPAGYSDLRARGEQWLKQMEAVEYSCLGCEHCYPAVVTNLLSEAFPDARELFSVTCAVEMREGRWPPVPGEYFTFRDERDRPVAVSTLASVELSERLASLAPAELCIVGKTETENIGIEKIIKNTITNPAIRVLLLVGQESKGHQSGRTLLALSENGVDEGMCVIGSPGKRPVLRNVTEREVEAFRKQVLVIDRIGCEDPENIAETVEQLSREVDTACTCATRPVEGESVRISAVPVTAAKGSKHVEMDKAGYFVIIPQRERSIITVEHYSYENKLLGVIEGTNAKSIYGMIIENGWVTELSHAAYLGNELARAELSIERGFKYVQGGAG